MVVARRQIAQQNPQGGGVRAETRKADQERVSLRAQGEQGGAQRRPFHWIESGPTGLREEALRCALRRRPVPVRGFVYDVRNGTLREVKA